MEPYTSRHAGVVSAIRAITKLESIKSKRAKHSIGGEDLSSHIWEGWPPRSQSSGVLALRCRYLSHPRERSESIGDWLTVFIKLALPPPSRGSPTSVAYDRAPPPHLSGQDSVLPPSVKTPDHTSPSIHPRPRFQRDTIPLEPPFTR